jgi:predicted membrane protein
MNATSSPASRSNGRLVAGALLILFGVLFTLDNMGVLDAGDVLTWWPVILIALGLFKVVRPAHEGERKVGYVLLAIGAFLQLQLLGLTRMRSAWPFLLVVIGGFLVWRALGRGKGPPTAESASQLSEFAMMGGLHRVVESSDFRGGEATAVMGAVELDLRGSTIVTSPAVIDVFALWGGIEITVPTDWKVDVQGMPILGAFENKARSSGRDSSAPAQDLVIRGTALMGGVEIKN